MSDFVRIKGLCFKKSQFRSAEIFINMRTPLLSYILKIKMEKSKHTVYFDDQWEAQKALQKIIGD